MKWGMNNLDKYDFINCISDIFSECKTEEQIESRAKQMIVLIEQQEILSKQYLKAGIL